MGRRTAAFACTALLGSLVALASCGADVKVDSSTFSTGTGGTVGTGMGTASGGAAVGTGAGADPGVGATTGPTSTTAVSSSVSTSSSSGNACMPSAPLTGACVPGAACENASPCLAHVSQAGSSTPGFRMSQVTLSAPAAIATGTVATVFGGNVTPDDPVCNLNGSGTLSWLLRFDLGAATLEIGAAKPAASPAGPYPFVDQMVQQGPTTFHVQPVVASAPYTMGCGFASSAVDVILPIYLDEAGTVVVLLPLRDLQLGGTTSADLGCIGRYNAQGLDPADNCLPDAQHPAFLPGGKISGAIRLEDADTILVSVLNETLCVLLSQNPTMYATKGPSGNLVCKRDANGHIVFQGDFCSTTDQPGGCADALKMSATFAAQAVTIQ